jgi:hypothetical protein
MNAVVTKISCGEIEIKDRVMVTDPSYDSTCTKKVSNVKMTPGIYECNAYKVSRDAVNSNFDIDKIYGLELIRKDSKEEINKKIEDSENKTILSEIGKFAVDSGLASVLVDDGDEIQDDLMDYIYKAIEPDSADIIDVYMNKHYKVFSSSTGYGDGIYKVYGVRDKKWMYNCIEILFME